ncbi:hypothetical protein, partial [Nostoc sp. 'Peltigera membranacea cyanobiont' 232]|uniref:hypothetical protein n=1 Tax=Nostoc sp. 'Peltigera membranacea cyanobiont' 232 TaxID=2014531 RepID=UPI000B9F2905
AGEQGSRGAGEQGREQKYQVLSPLPLCPSAPLLYQTPEACEKCGRKTFVYFCGFLLCERLRQRECVSLRLKNPSKLLTPCQIKL